MNPGDEPEMTGEVTLRSDWREQLLEEKGTTPESGGEVRIPIGPGRDTPMVDPPLPSFTTPTPVHDGELILPATWLPA
jgi:hypothetical protein